MEQIDPFQDQLIKISAPAPDHADCPQWNDLQSDDSDVEDYGYIGLDSEAYGLHRTASCKAQDKLVQYVLSPLDLMDHLKSQLKELHQIYDEFPEGYYLEILEANDFNLKATRKCLTDCGFDMIEKFPIVDAVLGAGAECPVCGEDLTESNAVHAGCGHFVCTHCLA